MDVTILSKVFFNPSVIKYILTLRYNPEQTSLLPKLSWRDFIPEKKTNPVDDVKLLIKKSIENQLGNSKPETISMSLSGGMDSTTILAFLKQSLPDTKIKTLSVRFADSKDETKRAKIIADKLQVDNETIFIENYLKELPEAINSVGQPFWDLHWFYVAKKAKTYSNFLASGDGGDELFGGYTFRYKNFLSLTSNTTTPEEKVKAYLKCHERDRVPDQEIVFGNKIPFSWDSIYELLLPFFDNDLDNLTQVFLADYNGKLLYNFMPIGNNISQYFGLNSINPLLSKEIIQFTARLPKEQKYDISSNDGKSILKKILQEFQLDNLVSHEKLGFTVDTINLWKNYGQSICKHFLTDARIVKEDWINPNWISKHIDNKDLEIRYIYKFLGLLALEIWYRIFFTKEMKSSETLSN